MTEFHFEYKKTTISALPEPIQQLIYLAADATKKAYAPYSNFLVGAALQMDDGTTAIGANHENASFPAGICAERALLGGLDMGSNHKVKAIAISYNSQGDHTAALSPCGICRQTILEVQLHQGAPIAIYMCSPDGDVIVVDDASYLLPFHFSRKNLDM